METETVPPPKETTRQNDDVENEDIENEDTDSDMASEADTDSVGSDWTHSKDEIEFELDQVKAPGSPCFDQILGATPDSLGVGVTINDVGPIKFPLAEEQAQQIISKARLAPHGRGEETVVDTAVRNTWELDLNQFKLTETAKAKRKDSGWSFVLRIAKYIVSEGLGIEYKRIRAEPYKMLLYEKGAHFKSHTEYVTIPLPLCLMLASSSQSDRIVPPKSLACLARLSLFFRRRIRAVIWSSDTSNKKMS